MDRHMRRRVYIFLIMVVVGYVSVFEVMYPDKGGILKKVYQDKIAGTSQTDTGIRIETVANTTSQPGEKQVFYTLAPNNLTRDKVYELMLGKEGSE